MKTVIETITPEKARAWLDKNTRNRRLRQSQVDKLARDMVGDHWHMNHQGIGIAPTFIADGQHRLHAVVQSGVAVQMNVTYYDTDEEAMHALLVVDKGATRSDADVQSLSGIMHKDTAARCVAIIKQWKLFGFSAGGHTMSTDEISATYLSEQFHIDWAVKAVDDPEAPKRFTSAQRAAFAICHKIDAAIVERLAAQVVAADETQGPVALMWTKLASQGRLASLGRGNEPFYFALRLLQAEILAEPPPQKMSINKSVVQWVRDRIQKKNHAGGPTDEPNKPTVLPTADVVADAPKEEAIPKRRAAGGR